MPKIFLLKKHTVIFPCSDLRKRYRHRVVSINAHICFFPYMRSPGACRDRSLYLTTNCVFGLFMRTLSFVCTNLEKSKESNLDASTLVYNSLMLVFGLKTDSFIRVLSKNFRTAFLFFSPSSSACFTPIEICRHTRLILRQSHLKIVPCRAVQMIVDYQFDRHSECLAQHMEFGFLLEQVLEKLVQDGLFEARYTTYTHRSDGVLDRIVHFDAARSRHITSKVSHFMSLRSYTLE